MFLLLHDEYKVEIGHLDYEIACLTEAIDSLTNDNDAHEARTRNDLVRERARLLRKKRILNYRLSKG